MADEAVQSIADERWMNQALDLARLGIGLASPNPTVGCAIVREGHLVGAGFHQYERRDHAEVVALREAGDLARDATAYVTLEPCSHHGRTGPCADVLIAAGIKRVVVATADANPQVHGHGIERMRQAGIEVRVGVMQEEAQHLNDAFAEYIRTKVPFVTLKAGMTLDGRIAPPISARKPGEISWITGAESRLHVHKLRHEVDAVVTGIGTVLADDPLLTDRSDLPRRRPLLRVVLDSQLRMPLESKLVQSVKDDVLVFSCEPKEERVQALSATGVTVKQLAPEPGGQRLSLAQVLKELGAMQITSLMVEAGSQINTSFLESGLVDRLFLFYAPSLLGPDATPLLAHSLSRQPAIQKSTIHRFGRDFAIETTLSNPWQP